jgi:hypothetical protein
MALTDQPADIGLLLAGLKMAEIELTAKTM